MTTVQVVAQGRTCVQLFQLVLRGRFAKNVLKSLLLVHMDEKNGEKRNEEIMNKQSGSKYSRQVFKSNKMPSF